MKLTINNSTKNINVHTHTNLKLTDRYFKSFFFAFFQEKDRYNTHI